MEGKKRVTKTETSTIIDEQTGEILKTTNVESAYVASEPPYVKMYIDDIMRLKEMPGAAGKVLNVLVSNMSYGNVVVLLIDIKKLIMQATGLSIHTVNKSIAQLHKANILIRKGKSVYIVDPTLFARGKWDDIKKLRLTIDYNIADNTKTINSNMVEQLKLSV